MSRQIKNIGNYTIALFNNSTNAFITEIEPNGEYTFDVAVTVGVRYSDLTNPSNFYMNYSTGTAFTDTTSTNCVTFRIIARSNVTGDNRYLVMSQYFGSTSSNDHVTVEPKIIENGNIEIINNIANSTASLPFLSTNTARNYWFIPSLYYGGTMQTGTVVDYNIELDIDSDYEIDGDNLPTATFTYITGTGTETETFTYTAQSSSFVCGIVAQYQITGVVLNGTLKSTSSTIKNEIGVSYRLTNCTASISPSTPTNGDDLTVTITANENYKLTSAQIEYTDISAGAGLLYYDLTISSDGKTATGTLTGLYDGGTGTYSITIIGLTTLDENVPVVSTKFIDVSELTQDNLVELAGKRWYVADSENPQNVVDLAYYIQSLKKFYCDIPTSATGDLVLGFFDTGVNVEWVSSDTVTLDCGTITVNSTNGNINDFTNTEAQILLPFIGIQTLNEDWIIGKSIHLYYIASVITGDCVAYIETDDVILYEFTGNISEDVPYVLNNIQWQLKGSISFNSTSLYGLVPILTVFYHNNYNDNESIVINDEKYSLLSDLSGLCYVDNVYINNSDISDDIKTLITTTLSNGVIF